MGNEIEEQSGVPDSLPVDKVDVPDAQEIEDVKGEVQRMVGAEQVESVELPEGIEFYQSNAGVLIAFSRNFHKAYISRDGGPLIEQIVTPLPFGGKIYVRDPSEGSSIILTIGDESIRTREEVFERIATPSKISSVILIPEKIQTEYHFQLSDGTPFLVTSDLNAGDYYTSFVIKIEDKKLRTTRARRARDGGTTIIETDQGIFRIEPYSESPTWNGEPLLNVS